MIVSIDLASRLNVGEGRRRVRRRVVVADVGTSWGRIFARGTDSKLRMVVSMV